MKKAILKITILSLFAAAFVAAPLAARAQATTNATTATATGKKAKKTAVLNFSGKVSAVDTNAMTLTVGKHVMDITSETKITADGKPATLADTTVGEAASGTYKKETGGKLSAATVNYTTKAPGTKKKKQLTTGTTNSVAK
jgi:hypothetical protein